LSFLIRDHDIDDDSITFSEEEMNELSQVWFDITCEYNELFGEKVNGNNYLIVAQISQMAQELEIVGSMLALYQLRPSERLKKALWEWKYKADDPDACEKKLKALKFKMDFNTSKHKELFNEPEEGEKKEYKIYDDVVRMENSMGITIDVHKTVLEKWASLIMKNDEMMKSARKNAKK